MSNSVVMSVLVQIKTDHNVTSEKTHSCVICDDQTESNFGSLSAYASNLNHTKLDSKLEGHNEPDLTLSTRFVFRACQCVKPCMSGHATQSGGLLWDTFINCILNELA